MHHFNNEKYKTPNNGWSKRNSRIASLLEDNKTVLDLGCGYKNLLDHYTPYNYLGVDWFDYADIVLNLYEDFHLQIPNGWDYVISSGVMEYLDNIEDYLKKVNGLGKTYIFTWWAKPDRYTHDEVKNYIKKNYRIISENDSAQRIYLCESL